MVDSRPVPDRCAPQWIAPRQAPDETIDVFYIDSDDAEDLCGEVLDERFELLQKFGEGGTSAVYRTLDRVTGAKVVTKVLNCGMHERLEAWFRQEGRLSARHNARRVAHAYHFGAHEGHLFTVFHPVLGDSLDVLRFRKPMPWRRLCGIVLQVLEGLEDLHGEGIVHRDVQPANVIVRALPTGGDDVTLIDLGFAAVMPPHRVTAAPEPVRPIVFGRTGYIAPEALAGAPPAPPYDLYALGVLMFECLSGHDIPDYGIAPGVLAVPSLRALAPGAKIPSAIDAVVLRAVSDVDARFQSATEMAQALREAMQAPSEPIEESATAPSRLSLRGMTPDQLRSEVIAGRYELERVLGIGGQAAVFDAWDAVDRHRVALKVLRPEAADDPVLARRFMHEAQILMQLRSEYVVSAYARGEDRGVSYLALEFIEGRTLEQIRGAAWLHWPRVLEIGVQACKALHAVHRAGVIHRDISPANFMWVYDPERPVWIKLLDCGASKLTTAWYDRQPRDATRPRERQVTQDGSVLGRRDFLPPEAGRSPPDVRYDVFALGVMLYELATGARPYPLGYPRDGRKVEPKPLAESAPQVEVPAELAEVILRAVAWDPADRWESAQALFEALIEAHALLDDEAQGYHAIDGALRFDPRYLQAPAGAINLPDWATILPRGELRRAVVPTRPPLVRRAPDPATAESPPAAATKGQGSAPSVRPPLFTVHGRRWAAASLVVAVGLTLAILRSPPAPAPFKEPQPSHTGASAAPAASVPPNSPAEPGPAEPTPSERSPTQSLPAAPGAIEVLSEAAKPSANLPRRVSGKKRALEEALHTKTGAILECVGADSVSLQVGVDAGKLVLETIDGLPATSAERAEQHRCMVRTLRGLRLEDAAPRVVDLP